MLDFYFVGRLINVTDSDGHVLVRWGPRVDNHHGGYRIPNGQEESSKVIATADRLVRYEGDPEGIMIIMERSKVLMSQDEKSTFRFFNVTEETPSLT